MNFKFLVFSLVLVCHNSTFAAEQNLCDQLEEAGDSSEEIINNCRRDNGDSAYHKEKQLIEKMNNDAKVSSEKSAQDKAAQLEKKKENILYKTFSSDDLFQSGYKKDFFAFIDDKRSGELKSTRATEGDSLCTYLGYEKAVKSRVSSSINQSESNNKGLIIEKGFLFGTKKTILYKQDDPKVSVRKYLEITCMKRKDKKVDIADEALKSVVEELVLLPPAVNPVVKDASKEIVNEKRSEKAATTTPHGYQVPEWMKDNNASGTGK